MVYFYQMCDVFSGLYNPPAPRHKTPFTHVECVNSEISLSKGLPGRVAQSVTCLATDACLTADPGVASSIPARYHTFVEIDHEIISTVILLLPLIYSRRVVVSYKRKYVHKLLVNRLLKPAQEKSVVKWTDRPAMTISVDMGRKATKTNKNFG